MNKYEVFNKQRIVQTSVISKIVWNMVMFLIQHLGLTIISFSSRSFSFLVLHVLWYIFWLFLFSLENVIFPLIFCSTFIFSSLHLASPFSDNIFFWIISLLFTLSHQLPLHYFHHLKNNVLFIFPFFFLLVYILFPILLLFLCPIFFLLSYLLFFYILASVSSIPMRSCMYSFIYSIEEAKALLLHHLLWRAIIQYSIWSFFSQGNPCLGNHSSLLREPSSPSSIMHVNTEVRDVLKKSFHFSWMKERVWCLMFIAIYGEHKVWGRSRRVIIPEIIRRGRKGTLLPFGEV